MNSHYYFSVKSVSAKCLIAAFFFVICEKALSQSYLSNADKFVDIITYCNPHMLKAYKQYKINGTGEVGKWKINHGKLVSYWSYSQNIYLEQSTITRKDILYSDSTIILECHEEIHKDFGGKSSNNSHSQRFLTVRYGISTGEYKIIDDSTIFWPDRKWTILLTSYHCAISTGYPDDLFNIDIQYDKDGFPVKIQRGLYIECYEYIEYDELGNWIKRRVTSGDNEYFESRNIKYSCNRCGGTGYVTNDCPHCRGTGRCQVNPKGSPDEAVGLCPYCRGRGRTTVVCSKCK